MHAHAGDRIVVPGHRVSEPAHEGEVLEAHGADDTAPFLVRWLDDGHESLYFPGPDAHVRSAGLNGG